VADKMRTQTLHEQGLGAKTIVKAYLEKQRKLSSMQTICQCIDKTGSAVDRRAGSGRSKSAHMAETETLKLDINFPKEVLQDYVGKVGKSITSVLHIISIYSVPNIVEIGQHM